MKFVKNINEIQNEEDLDKIEYKTTNSIRIDGTSFELGENCLVLRKQTKYTKEKILVELNDITATRVKKKSNTVALFLSIFFLVVGAGATIPLYIYFRFWGFLSLGLGVILFGVFLGIYLMSRRIKVVIYRRSGEPIRRLCNEIKLFNTLNEFFDELFYRKGK
jgi:hypothetical protein